MSNIIDSIQVSGTVYQIQGSGGGNPTVELTQEQYDALVSAGTVSPTTYYIITDAPSVDMTNYYTKSQTSGATEISTALASKQNTLVAGDNITITSGNVISANGGGVNVVQTTGTSTTDVMSQNAVTNSLDNLSRISRDSDEGITRWYNVKKHNGTYDFIIYNFSINGKLPLSKETRNSDYSNIFNFHLVETSAITTSITSASTDSQVPSAKAVYDQFGGLKLVKLTQQEYDALTTKDSNTLYIING